MAPDAKASDAKTEQKVEHYLISKLQLLAALGLFMATIIGLFFRIQLDVALIRQNHEAHIQAILENMQRMEEENKEQNDRLEKQNDGIIRLLQMHEK
jgi:hypothetical protein